MPVRIIRLINYLNGYPKIFIEHSLPFDHRLAANHQVPFLKVADMVAFVLFVIHDVMNEK